MVESTATDSTSDVLIVDDDQTTRLLMRNALEQFGFNVTEACNGKEALESIHQSYPDVILLDVIMPEMDGFAVLRALRRTPENKQLPVVMVTSLNDVESINRAYSSGATTFITKPINFINLSHHVRYVLRSKRAWENLRTSEARLADAQRVAKIGHWEWDVVHDALYWSDELLRIMGLPPGEFNANYEAFLAMVHPQDLAFVQEAVQQALDGECDFGLEHRIVRPDGNIRLVHARADITFDLEGRPLRMLGTVHDITDRKQTEEKLLLAGQVFENSSEIIVIADRFANIIDINPSFTKATGFKRQEIIGQNIEMLKPEHYEARFFKDLMTSLLKTGQWQGEIWGRRKNGKTIPIFATIKAVKDKKGATVKYVSIASDITKLKKVQKQLHYVAHFDTLTGLPNRALFQDRLKLALAQAIQDKSLVALMLLDLNNFKDINDRIGHRSGDQLLKRIAMRLINCIQKGDTVARLGGVELAIVARNIADINAAALSAGSLLEAVQKPLDLDGQQIQLTACIGVAMCPFDGDEADELIKKADMAMYHAKKKGSSGYLFFSDDMQNQRLKRRALQTSLHQALEREEFVVYYQPKIDILNSRVTGLEALLRWQHPEEGLIPAEQFIDLAQEIGLIASIDAKVLQIACNHSKTWQNNGQTPQKVSVHLSAQHLHDNDLPDQIAQVLKENEIKY